MFLEGTESATIKNAAFPQSRRGTLPTQKRYCLIVKLNKITSTTVI